MKENQFRDRVIRKELDRLPNCYYFIKEAVSLRGLPDIVGVCNGYFFALEIKRSEAEASKKTGRIVLQRFILEKIEQKGGFACFVYPEVWPVVLDNLKRLACPI